MKKENQFFKYLFKHFKMELPKDPDINPETKTTEDDMSEELKAQVAELTSKVGEFEKTLGEKDKEIESLKATIQTSADTTRKVEHKSFCDTLVTEGKLLPANVEMTMENMELRYQADLTKGKDAASLEAYKTLLNGGEKVVEMAEVATKSAATEIVSPSSDKFTDLVRARQVEKKISFSDAIDEISLEQPELAKAYAQ